MTGLFLCKVSVLPQLWLISHTGGRIEALMSHNIFAMGLSSMLGGLFMFYAREDITCAFWIEDVNHAVLAILSAYALHLLLLSDFVYLYVKAVATQGLGCQVDME